MRHTMLMVCGLLVIVPIVLAQELPISEPPQDNAGDTPSEAKSVWGSGKDTLFWAGDVDFFKFTISSNKDNPEITGNMTVKLSQKAPPGINPNSGWRLDLYSEEDLANSIYTTTLLETSLSTEFEQGLSPGRYYYKVSSISNEVFPTAEYIVKNSLEKSAYYEKELNNDSEKATAIQVHETYYGNLSFADDIDYYRFNLQMPDIVTIILSQERQDINPAIGWQLRLLSPNLPQQIIDIPLTQLSNVLQASLDIGEHYILVTSLPQAEPQTEEVNGNSNSNEENTQKTEQEKTEQEKALIGRRYQLLVEAPTVPKSPTVEACEFVYTYAQNPVTLRWVAMPSPCDVPVGWATSLEAPDGYEVCPSPRASYKLFMANEAGVMEGGDLNIPVVELRQSKTPQSLWRVQMQQINTDPIQFQISDLKFIREIKSD